jgi:hypothetical protein
MTGAITRVIFARGDARSPLSARLCSVPRRRPYRSVIVTVRTKPFPRFPVFATVTN